MTTMGPEERAIGALRALYARYGYTQYKMSRFEEYDLYVRNKDFLVSDQVITFTDTSGRLLALKPDVTLSILKNTDPAPGTVRKVYYHENVYRVDPASHAFKEIPQVGLECIGALTDYEIAETIVLAARSLSLLAEKSVLELSHMGLVSAMLAASGLEGKDQKAALALLRQKNGHELRDLASRCGADWGKLSALLTDGGMEVLSALEPVLTTDAEREAFAQVRRLCDVLRRCGVAEAIRLDFSVSSDMKYYSGVVFRGYVPGVPESVLSGGQYDRLAAKLGKQGSAIGFAVYAQALERLHGSEQEYDVDTLLLYDEADDPAAVLLTCEAMPERVLAAREIPKRLTYRRLMRLKDGEAVVLEDNG